MRGRGVVVLVALGVAGCKSSSPSNPDGSVAVDAPMSLDAPGSDAPGLDAPDGAMPTYRVGGRVTNLLGSGLVLALDGGATLTINADGTFVFPDMRTTGAPYTVTIQTLPSSPAQTCTIAHDMGTIGTADVTDVAVTCSLGGLRINEISACFYTDVPCWAEVVNTGALTEQLSDYDLRSTAIERMGGTQIAPQRFDLPALAIPPGGHVIVRGQGVAGLTDGPKLVHVVDPATTRVPYWPGGGFVELVRANKTVDFVRMGSDTTPPTTTGWTGAGAPAITPTAVYGAVIARSAASMDTDTAGDWSRRAFATPGGPNDITSDVDLDSDGIPDQAEVSGGTFAGLDLYARGVRAGQRDVLIEVDYMPHATDPGVKPLRATLDEVIAAFAPHGIAVHFDVGSLFSTTVGAADHNFGGGNEVPFSTVVSLFLGAGVPDLYGIKMQQMDVRLQAVSHYMLFAYTLDVQTLGIGEIEGNDVIVSLGGIGLGTGTAQDALITQHLQASTVMHELGHNLGLHHGGDNDINGKPNYVSVMNYMYVNLGIPVIGNAEGDRYYLGHNGCGGLIANELQLQNSRWTSSFVIDYSNGTSAPLNEAAIVESAGLGRPGSVPVDFNCDGAIGTVAFDVDGDGMATAVHTDHDDWGTLRLPFARSVGGASLVARPRLSPFTDERRTVADETGFRPRAALR